MAFLGIEPIEVGVADPTKYGAKPLFFFDIDGVINRIPFLEVYIGPSCDCPPGGMYSFPCKHRSDKNNWTVRRVELEDDLFDDVPSTIDGGHQIHEDWKFKTWISEELANEFRALYHSEKIDIIFLSMWQENTRYLNGYLGTEIPHISIPRRMSESEHSAKHSALFSFLSKVEKSYGSIPAFGWVDDVVTATSYGVDIHAQIAERLLERAIEEPATLILNPATTEGIRRSQWQQILDFSHTHGVAQSA